MQHILLTCNAGYEDHLERETGAAGFVAQQQGPEWLLGKGDPQPSTITQLCFAHYTLVDPLRINQPSSRVMAGNIADYFCQSIGDERIVASWPLLVFSPQGVIASSRVSGLTTDITQHIRKRMSRIAKLADLSARLLPGQHRGLFVYMTDQNTCFVARDCFFGGQRRMRDDPGAPSRSYLKAEEAYGILGYQPAEGETVVDLGAAPGGWSYSAAKRGARVIAVDNGPLKGAALGHPLIEHHTVDAFGYGPGYGQCVDWLFCDMVEDPSRVLELVRHWLRNGWCRRIVVNLKFGRSDPVRLLGDVRSTSSGLGGLCGEELRIRHLYHDREEFTLVGTAG